MIRRRTCGRLAIEWSQSEAIIEVRHFQPFISMLPEVRPNRPTKEGPHISTIGKWGFPAWSKSGTRCRLVGRVKLAD